MEAIGTSEWISTVLSMIFLSSHLRPLDEPDDESGIAIVWIPFKSTLIELMDLSLCLGRVNRMSEWRMRLTKIEIESSDQSQSKEVKSRVKRMNLNETNWTFDFYDSSESLIVRDSIICGRWMNEDVLFHQIQ